MEETYNISDYSKGDIEKEEGNSFSILHLACMPFLLYFTGDRSLAVFVVFFLESLPKFSIWEIVS